MLEFFRKNATIIGWVIVIFFGATILSGAFLMRQFSGAAKKMQKEKSQNVRNEFILIGKKPVNPKKYYEILSSIYQYVYQQTGNKLNPETKEMIQNDAMNKVVQYTLLLEEAKRQKLRVKSNDINKALHQVYVRFNIKGKKELKKMLKEKKYPYKQFLEEMKNDILVEKMVLQLQGQIQVSNKDIDNKYTKLQLAHILIKVDPKDPNSEKIALTTIQKIQAEIKSGMLFSEAAKTYSEDPGSKDNNGQLPGLVTVGQTVEEFEKVAFALDKGEVSRPVRTPFGYHLIHIIDRVKIEKPKTFDLEKEKTALLKERQAQAVSRFSQKIVQFAGLQINEPSLKPFHEKSQGRFQEAVYAYKTLISQSPSNPEPHYLLAKLYILLQKMDEAKEELIRADIKSEMNALMDFPGLHLVLGNIYEKENNKKEMIVQYDKAESLAQNDVSILTHLESIYSRLNKKDKAAQVKARIVILKKEAEEKAKKENQQAS